MSNRFLVLAALFTLPSIAAAAEDAAAIEAAAVVPVQRDWTVTVGGGALATPSYPGASSFTVLPLPYIDVRYRDRFFLSPFAGIDANQSATSRALPTYSAGAGLRDAALALFAVMPLDEHWSVQTLVKAEMLLGDAASSPLTEQRIQPTVGGFVAYRL